MRTDRSALISLLFFVAACGNKADTTIAGATDEQGFTITAIQPDPSQPKSNSSQTDDNGTRLDTTETGEAQPCSEESVPFNANGLVTTTGSVDSVVITAIIDQGAENEVGLINPQDFVHDGRNKTAPYDVTTNLSPGDHTFQLCFTQSGAQGRKPKRTCGDSTAITASCEIGL